jgi:hypothetical protein
MILDGSKEQVKRVFKHKLKKVNCHMCVAESGIPPGSRQPKAAFASSSTEFPGK